jgi:hypothetical protein
LGIVARQCAAEAIAEERFKIQHFCRTPPAVPGNFVGSAVAAEKKIARRRRSDLYFLPLL